MVTAMRAAGMLWTAGVRISLEMVNRNATTEPNNTALVDLPSYAWNHAKTFWHESPAIKQQRLQKKPRTDLLGAPVEDPNPLEPQWRNHLRVRENPWVEDHKITGTILYPGAGMLIMVIEAIAGMVSTTNEVQGIEFKNVAFHKGLVNPQEGSAEIILRIQLLQSKSGSLSSHSFSIFSRIGDATWTKNCFGQFKILHKKTNSMEAGNNDTAAAFEWHRHITKYSALKQLDSTSVDVAKLYKKLDSIGMQYGPTFQNLTELYTVPGADVCYGTAKIPDTKSVMPFEHEFPHLIHPATLDAIFHLMVVAVAGGESLTEAAVPSMVEKLYISFDLPQGQDQQYMGYAERVYRRDKKLCADLVISDSEWKAPKVVVKGLIMTRVSSTLDGAKVLSREGENEKKSTKPVWDLDPYFAMLSSPRTSFGEISKLSDWLTLECHKAAQLKVAILGRGLNGDIFGDLIPFVNGKSLYRGFAHLAVVDIAEDVLEAWKPLVAAAETLITYLPRATWTESESRYDLIITNKNNESAADEMHFYRSKLSPNGRLIVVDTGLQHSLTNEASHGDSTLATKENKASQSQVIKNEEVLALQLGSSPTFGILMDYPAKLQGEQEILLLGSSSSARDPSEGSQLLSEQLSRSSLTARFVSLEDAANLQDKTIICLLDGSYIGNWTAEEFQSFQAVIS